jgi:hypothetical protein
MIRIWQEWVLFLHKSHHGHDSNVAIMQYMMEDPTLAWDGCVNTGANPALL